jgi:hypothetical protein
MPEHTKSYGPNRRLGRSTRPKADPLPTDRYRRRGRCRLLPPNLPSGSSSPPARHSRARVRVTHSTALECDGPILVAWRRKRTNSGI